VGSESKAKPGRYKSRPYLLKFDDQTDFPGLEVRIRRVGLGMMGELAEMADEFTRISQNPGRARTVLKEFCESIAPSVIWWNVDDDNDQPVTPDTAGLMIEDGAMIVAIFKAWFDRATLVPPPLPSQSPAGEPEVPIPMVSLPS
jgi:hypothetical protein